jgi:hypothetical protein
MIAGRWQYEDLAGWSRCEAADSSLHVHAPEVALWRTQTKATMAYMSNQKPKLGFTTRRTRMSFQDRARRATGT